MSDIQDIYLERTFNFLVCKLHGFGVHPTAEAIRRHLRGEDHRCRGEALKDAIAQLTSLPLSSMGVMRNFHPAIDVQPVVPPLSHLRILHGWCCLPCAGHFLTTSLEIIRRHAAAVHGRRRNDQPLWKPCEMQTFFSETKDRRYFRVSGSPAVNNNGNTEVPVKKKDRQSVQKCRDQVDHVSNVTESCSYGEGNGLTKDFPQFSAHITDLKASQWPMFYRSVVSSSPVQPPICWHPFTSFAAKHVPLPIARLDRLFKSNAFRTASEPLFDPNHVDSALSMHAVFPHSEEEPAFLNALLYSMIQTTNRGKPTTEGVSLQARIIKLLNLKLSSLDPSLSQADIGAIMILKTTAYKYCDHVAHDVHTRGLSAALETCSKGGNSLTVAAERGVFWQDLCASVLIGSDRSIPGPKPPEGFTWYRERCPELSQALPIGFVRHQNALPYNLLECVADVVEFQAVLLQRTVAEMSASVRYDTLEPMQASIESRLAVQKNSCTQQGVVAEACRLAVFMCCYCTWMERWNDSLTPCKLAERLIDLLEPTLFSNTQQNESVWSQRLDVLLWLLRICASVVELDQGHVEDLRSKQSHMFLSARAFLSDYTSTVLEHLSQSALQDFIYSKVWLTEPNYGKDWDDLEQFIHVTKS